MKPNKKYIDRATALINLYTSGFDLSAEDTHVLFDCAAEYGQILDNVIETSWYKYALAEKLAFIDCFAS